MKYEINNKGKKEINKQILIMVISVFVIVISTIGVTLAAFVWTDSSEKSQNVVVGNLSLEISSSSETLGSDLDIPVSDEDVDTLTPYTFTLNNTGEVDAFYKLKIVDDEQVIASDECADNQIDKQYIGIKVTEGNNIVGILKDYENSSIDSGILKAKESKKYNVYLWLKEGAPNEIIGKHYHGKIEVETEQTIDNEKMLAESILEDNEVQENYEFTTTSQDKGLFKLKNEVETTKPIYFFKGAVDNNYIQFGTYKSQVTNIVNESGFANKVVANANDPILWRIVRINEDNSITIIAEHNIGNANHVWNSKDKADYINPDDKSPSDVKKVIDEWYDTTFVKVDSKLDELVKETEFCNDRSNDYKGVSERLDIDSPNPTLKCERNEDIVKSKVGLITADEMVYAGALYYKSVTSNTTYLNNHTSFWSISPLTSSSEVCWNTVLTNLAYDCYTWAHVVAARPVITLLPSTTITTDFLSEDEPGTINNPYKVVVR